MMGTNKPLKGACLVAGHREAEGKMDTLSIFIKSYCYQQINVNVRIVGLCFNFISTLSFDEIPQRN